MRPLCNARTLAPSGTTGAASAAEAAVPQPSPPASAVVRAGRLPPNPRTHQQLGRMPQTAPTSTATRRVSSRWGSACWMGLPTAAAAPCCLEAARSWATSRLCVRPRRRHQARHQARVRMHPPLRMRPSVHHLTNHPNWAVPAPATIFGQCSCSHSQQARPSDSATRLESSPCAAAAPRHGAP